MPELRKIMSVDAESNGLYGQVFAIGAVHSSDQGMRPAYLAAEVFTGRCPIVGDVDPWVTENVLPALAGTPETASSYRELLQQFAGWYDQHVPGAVVVAHIQTPVEAGLFRDMVTVLGRDPFSGPFPLHDAATLLLMAGEDPSSVDGYLTKHGLSVAPRLKGLAHHPLYDAAAVELCTRHLLSRWATAPAELGSRDAAASRDTDRAKPRYARADGRGSPKPAWRAERAEQRPAFGPQEPSGVSSANAASDTAEPLPDWAADPLRVQAAVTAADYQAAMRQAWDAWRAANPQEYANLRDRIGQFLDQMPPPPVVPFWRVGGGR